MNTEIYDYYRYSVTYELIKFTGHYIDVITDYKNCEKMQVTLYNYGRNEEDIRNCLMKLNFVKDVDVNYKWHYFGIYTKVESVITIYFGDRPKSYTITNIIDYGDE